MRLILIAFAALALAGCGARQSSDTAAAPPASNDAPAVQPAVATGDDAAKPALIAELTDQKVIYECPKCGMMYDKAGTCMMGCAETVAMQVDYSCPKDGKPVAKAGHCERCPMNAKVEKTAMAASSPSDKN